MRSYIVSDEQIRFVKRELRRGLTNKQIVDLDKTHTLTRERVRYIRKRLIEKGEIEKEDMNKAKVSRKREFREKLRYYVSKGLSYEEISKILGFNRKNVEYIRKACIEENNWFSETEISNFRFLRKMEIYERKPERLNLEKEIERLIKNKEREKQNRKEPKLEISDIKSMPQEEQLKTLQKKINIIRQAAENEANMEEDGNWTLSKNRKKFIDLLVEISKLEGQINKEDIDFTINCFIAHPKIANKGNIKMILDYIISQKDYNIMNKVVDALSETQYSSALSEYRRNLKKVALTDKVKELKSTGLSNSEISEKLGISSSEVALLLSGRLKAFIGDEFER